MAHTIRYDNGQVMAVCPLCGIHQPVAEADAAGKCTPSCSARSIRQRGLWRVTQRGVEMFRGSDSGCLGFVLRVQAHSYEYARQYSGYLIEKASDDEKATDGEVIA